VPAPLDDELQVADAGAAGGKQAGQGMDGAFDDGSAAAGGDGEMKLLVQPGEVGFAGGVAGVIDVERLLGSGRLASLQAVQPGKNTLWGERGLEEIRFARKTQGQKGFDFAQVRGGTQVGFIDHQQPGFFDLLVKDVDHVVTEGHVFIAQAPQQQAGIGKGGKTGRGQAPTAQLKQGFDHGGHQVGAGADGFGKDDLGSAARISSSRRSFILS